MSKPAEEGTASLSPVPKQDDRRQRLAATLKRKIVRIDEEKCNGCGLCVPSCVEGALRIIGGKARLVSDKYCDGLGACLGECPQDAITIEEREAEDFKEEAARLHAGATGHSASVPHVCPSAAVARLAPQQGPARASAPDARPESRLGHWPVQLALVPPGAPFLQGADVVLAADCVPFAYAAFHQDFLDGRALLVACPKLDDFQAHQLRLAEVLRRSNINTITIVHMEVPCCSGLVHMVRQAIQMGGKEFPVNEVTIGIRGDRKS